MARIPTAFAKPLRDFPNRRRPRVQEANDMQPHFIHDQSAPWMGEFHKQLVRGKHVLLYGNVLDHFYVTRTGETQGRYVSVPEFLRLYFSDEGYEVIGHYDIVDGLTYADAS